ncbi:Thyroxine 5-deiodinase [Branchiostoma belcheri]|nr:Thyroxine 5-deiodinase [Branchiostoma belcheri]
MAHLARFNDDLVAEFADRADFLTVYIAEAHASDGWSFRNNIKISIKHWKSDWQQRTCWYVGEEGCGEEGDVGRGGEGREADSNLSGPLLVDTMDDVAKRKYGAWPERLYILLDGRVTFKASQDHTAITCTKSGTGWTNI